MRRFIIAPLLLAAGLALLPAGCSNSTKATAPVMDAPKPTQMEMNTGKGPNSVGRNPRTVQ
ncbi:MAG TPA: hypothetical protein VGF55_31965 [Gemmataceae bacterium]|jgi:hypothetical protein